MGYRTGSQVNKCIDLEEEEFAKDGSTCRRATRRVWRRTVSMQNSFPHERSCVTLVPQILGQCTTNSQGANMLTGKRCFPRRPGERRIFRRVSELRYVRTSVDIPRFEPLLQRAVSSTSATCDISQRTGSPASYCFTSCMDRQEKTRYNSCRCRLAYSYRAPPDT